MTTYRDCWDAALEAFQKYGVAFVDELERLTEPDALLYEVIPVNQMLQHIEDAAHNVAIDKE